MIITFTLPTETVDRVVAGLNYLYPQPEQFDGAGEPIPPIPDPAWAREVVRRWIVKQVARAEAKQQYDNIDTQPDDSLVL